MPEPTNGAVVLIGPPAVGKSTVGAVLASRLGVEFIDVDARIEDRAGCAITEIFAAQGEAGFRALEQQTTLEALTSGAVIALGGGAVTNPALRAALQGHQVVWLQASEHEAVRRVGEGTTRPLLAGDVAGRWRELAAAREPLYREVATITVRTDRRTPAQVARAVIAALDPEETP